MYDADDSDVLLAAAVAGIPGAWGRLLERYRPYLELLARMQIGRRLQGKADAQDVVQEAFLRAHRYFPQFRGTSSSAFAAWLREILASCLTKLVRRYLGTRGRDARLERDLTAELDHSSRALDAGLAGRGSTPSAAAARKETAVAVADALARLPDHYREALVLRSLEGRPFAEVADRLGRSPDAAEKLWARALAKLRAELEGTG